MKIPDSEYRALYSQLADLTEQRDKALADKGLLEEALRGLRDIFVVMQAEPLDGPRYWYVKQARRGIAWVNAMLDSPASPGVGS